MPRESPTEGFRAGYQSADGRPLPEFIGATLGMLLRTAAQTVVVVTVLRLLGVF